MLTRIMRHEWRSLAADRTLWAVALLFLGIVGYGVYNGAAWADSRAGTLQAVALDEAERVATLEAGLREIEAGRAEGGGWPDPGHPGSVGAAGVRHAALPPAPLASFAVGQSDLLPAHVRLSTREAASTLFENGEMENPATLLAGRFDLAFVVVSLFPLVILALAYNLLAGEREAGTLAMVLSHPVPLRTLAAGKLLLRFAVVAGLALGLAALGAAVAGGLGGESGARFALWAAVLLAYGGFWFAAALAVNALGRSSEWNATALLGLWLALVVVAPALVHVAATTLHPVPSRVEMVQAMRVASDEASAAGSTLLAQYYQDHPEMSPLAGDAAPGDFWRTSYVVQQEVARRTAPVQAHFDRQMERQQALVARWGFLSPAIVAQEALNDLSGTGLARFRHWRAQVERFHVEYVGFFVPRMLRGERLAVAEYGDFPRFRYREEAFGAVAARVGTLLLGIVLPALLLAGMGWARLRRYPLAG